MKENKSWSQFEDKVLRQLREEQGIKKWKVIAQKMQDEFKIIGKSGKKCRERYQNHLNTNVKRDQWSQEEELALFRLHNEKGNKWVEIAKELQRSDNAVKNHYHSKLRKALRKVNQLLTTYLRNQFKPLKNNIISKLLQNAEDYIVQDNKLEATSGKLCFCLKNRMLSFLPVGDKLTQQEIADLRTMIREINQFSKVYKKKAGPKEGNKQNLRLVRYKGKEILNLINENKLKIDEKKPETEEQIMESSQNEEEDSPIQVKKEEENIHLKHMQRNIRQSEIHSVGIRMLPGVTYPFSFFGNPCNPDYLSLLSYNYLLNRRNPFFPYMPDNNHFWSSHIQNPLTQEKKQNPQKRDYQQYSQGKYFELPK